MKPYAISLLSACTFALVSGCHTPDRSDSVSSSNEKIKILSLGFDSAQRDSVELSKQQDFVVKIVPVGGSILDSTGSLMEQKTFYWLDFHRSPENVEQDLLKALDQNHDVIIMGARPLWEKYPESVRKKILERVENGAVLSTFGASAAFREVMEGKWSREHIKLPFAAIPGNDPFRFEAWNFGRGKVITQPAYLDYRFGIFAPQITEAERGRHNYWMERYAELLRRARQKQQRAVSTVSAIYRQDGVFVPEGKIFSSGIYFAVTEYFDANHELTGKSGEVIVRDNPLGIRSLKFISDTVFKPGMSMKLRADWKQKSDSGESKLSLRDIYGRVFYRKTVQGTPEIIEVLLPEGSCSVLNFADLEYRENDEVPECASTEFTIPANRNRPDFYFLAWNGAVGATVRHMDYFKELKKNGIDGITNMAPNANTLRSATLAGLLCVPYTAAFHNTVISSFFDEKKIQENLEKAINAAELGKRYGVPAHSLGDENYVSAFKEEGRFWDDPKLWNAFREYLKRTYGSLEKLNQSWKKSYENWNEIRFAGEPDFFSFERPAAWVDYRSFVSEIFIRRQKELRDAIRKIDPETQVGWEGGEQYSSYDGYDLYEYVSEFDMSNVYARSFTSKMLPNKMFNGYCLRSFAPKKALTGFWMNGVDYPTELRTIPWLTLFSGMNSIWWWHSTFPEHESAALRYDFTPGGPFRETAVEVRKIKEGPATILKHAEAEKPNIAIYYSTANFHASNLSAVVGNHINNLGAHEAQWGVSPAVKMKNQPEPFKRMWGSGLPVGHYAHAFKAFATLVKDLNLDFTVIDRRQVENGILKDYRILILPFTESISDREAEAIRDFVNNGGCIIADYHTGIRDGQCNFRQTGVLDDLFGIRSSYPFRAQYKKESVIIESSMGDWLASFKLPVSFTQPELIITTGIPLGASDSGTPVFLFNRVGKGCSLYFNFDLYDYFELRRENRENDIREYFRNFLLRYCKWPSYDVIRNTDFAPLPATSIFRFHDGDVTYVGALSENLRNREKKVTVNVPMNQEGHLYDVLAKEYLGYGKCAEVKWQPGTPLLLASYPTRIESPDIKGEKDISSGKLLKLSINAGKEPHTVRIRVFAPDGTEMEHYGTVLYLKDGRGEFILHTALNDQPGRWKVTVEEVVSGKRNTHGFQLEK